MCMCVCALFPRLSSLASKDGLNTKLSSKAGFIFVAGAKRVFEIMGGGITRVNPDCSLSLVPLNRKLCRSIMK